MKLSCPLTIMQSKEQKVNQAINLVSSILYSEFYLEWTYLICLYSYWKQPERDATGSGWREWNRFVMLRDVKFLLLRYSAFQVIAIINLWNISSTPSLDFSASNNTHYAKWPSREPPKLLNGKWY